MPKQPSKEQPSSPETTSKGSAAKEPKYFNPGKCPNCGKSSTWGATSRVILPDGSLGDYRIYICVRCQHMSAY